MCDWHPPHGPLRRRERFLLALQAPCPECGALTRAYCRSHSPGGTLLRVQVHHARAALAEQTGCTCHGSELERQLGLETPPAPLTSDTSVR